MLAGHCFRWPCLLHRTWRTVFGQVDRRSANRHRSDPEFASCVSSTHGSLQYSFTLALEDGGTTRIGYGSESAAALMPLPSLAAWVGKSVNVAVTPYSEGCCAGGSFLTVTDSASLVLAMNTDGCKVGPWQARLLDRRESQ